MCYSCEFLALSIGGHATVTVMCSTSSFIIVTVALHPIETPRKSQLYHIHCTSLRQYTRHNGSFLELSLPALRKQRSSVRNSNIGPISLGTTQLTLHRSVCVIKKSFRRTLKNVLLHILTFFAWSKSHPRNLFLANT